MSIEQWIDSARVGRGFLRVGDLRSLAERGNEILDPFSTLISVGAVIGTGNIFYPGVTIEVVNGGTIEIGDRNTFHSQTYIVADQGTVRIADDLLFGDGGVTIKANVKGAAISCGSQGRYLRGPQVLGTTELGNGCQIIGPITVQDCTLEGGDTFQGPDPDLRGAVLKGFGLARKIHLRKGDVLNGVGTFDQASVERQSSYHPAPKKP